MGSVNTSKTDKVTISSHPVKCNLVMTSRRWLRVSHVLFLPSMVFKFTFRNSEIQFKLSLRSWRYCVGARLKFWRRRRVPKKGSRDEAVFLAASPLVTAPPSNLTRLYYNGSAAKSYSPTTQYRQLRRLIQALYPS